MSKDSVKKHKFSVVSDAESSDFRKDEFQDDPTNESAVCPRCFGSGMEIVDGKGARPCSCQTKTRQANPFDKARVPRRYLNCHFNSYEPSHPTQTQAGRFAMRFTQEFPAVDQGLLLMGPVGVGKTHLAVSILKGLTERGGFSCLFYEFGSLLKEIQDSYNSFTQSSELGVLSPVLNADVLVLDELGASKPTDWVKDTMAHIINTRYNDQKHTIFTTNYLEERQGNEETLEDRIGIRLRSRLYEMCRTIEIKGPDYRKTLQSGKTASAS